MTSHTSNLNFSRVDEKFEVVLGNLFELYCHDMSEWLDVQADEQGKFSSDYNAAYAWQDGGSVFLAKSGRLPIGFAIVQSATQYTGAEGWDLKEFFILRRYRRTGAGSALANFVWDTHPGNWLVRVHSDNRPAVPFWRTTVDLYTNGKYGENLRTTNGSGWYHFSFGERLPV